MAIDLTNTIGQNVQAAQEYSSSTVERLKNKDYAHAEDDELKEAVKSFESYFVEQVIKEVEKTIHTDDENSYAGQMTSYFKDSVIEKISDKIIDQSGGTYTQKLYEQMKRNYGIPDVPETEQSAEATEKDISVEASEKVGPALAEEEETHA